MSKIYEPCIACGKEALTEKGCIYVRAEIKGKWGNHTICMECYKKHYRPERDKKMPKSSNYAIGDSIKDYTHEDFVREKKGLIEKGLAIENPPGDLHLTEKGCKVARLLAQNQWDKDTLELSTMQQHMLEAIYHYE